MRYIFLTILTFCIVSCGTTKQLRTSKKSIKGAWELSTIEYSESGTFRTTLLNDVSKTCFEGSSWSFIPNNNSGTYSIDKSDCTTGTRNFIFTIQEIDATTGLYDFLLKPTNAKGKSENNVGFRLTLSALTEDTMIWEQKLLLDGKPLIISMNFTKQ